ncbi:recombinase family protein [bacterium]|nr:recombinase family protein [bacterium]
MSGLFPPDRTGRRIGYARVSTDDQTLYQYIDELVVAGCDKDDIFTDRATRATAVQRPGLQAARDALRPGDTLVVLDIDRAFRSAIEGLLFLDGLLKEGIYFLSIHEPYDTRTPEGWKNFCHAVVDAEYEVAKISRRTKQKMAAAKRRGIHLGRPYKLKKGRVLKAHHLVTERGQAVECVAKRYRVSPITMRRAFERYGLESG